ANQKNQNLIQKTYQRLQTRICRRHCARGSNKVDGKTKTRLASTLRIRMRAMRGNCLSKYLGWRPFRKKVFFDDGYVDFYRSFKKRRRREQMIKLKEKIREPFPAPGSLR